MKNKLHLAVFIAFILTILFSGCKKYEDGPVFSLASKKSRIVNFWTASEVFHEGVQLTLSFNVTFDIRKDGGYTYNFDTLSIAGKWAFSQDKESVILTRNDNGFSGSHKILRLTSKEFWLENGNEVVHYK